MNNTTKNPISELSNFEIDSIYGGTGMDLPTSSLPDSDIVYINPHEPITIPNPKKDKKG